MPCVSGWNPASLGVVVVDDQADVRSLIKKMLKDLKIERVLEANDGQEALTLLDAPAQQIDVVICDWNMPNMTGVELLKRVRSSGKDIPFLLVTGRADKDSVIEAKDSGVSAYIAKPFTQTQLEAKLRVVSAKRTKS